MKDDNQLKYVGILIAIFLFVIIVITIIGLIINPL